MRAERNFLRLRQDSVVAPPSGWRLLIVGIGLLAATVCDARPPTGLMCEFLGSRWGATVVEERPEFGWVVHSEHPDDTQTAYRVLVESEGSVVWDSGKVASDQSIDVEYGGERIRPGISYAWKVMTWTKHSGASDWSELHRFRAAKRLGLYGTSRHNVVETPLRPARLLKKGEGHYFIDFGKVAFGYLLLNLDLASDCVLEVRLAERGEAGSVNHAPGGSVRYAVVEQQVHAGKHRYRVATPPDERNTNPPAISLPPRLGVIMPFRYCEIVGCPIELDASMVTQVACHYPFDDTAASFSSSDALLNDVWELCRYTTKATTYCGLYVDGDRERIPYEGDAYINQLCHYAADREYAIARATHEYLLANPTWPTEWKQHSVMMAWADYMYTGNKESLREHYELLAAEKLLEHCARPDGLLVTAGAWEDPKWRDLVDWPVGERDGYDFREVNTVVNAFHYRNLLQMAEIAEALDLAEQAIEYERKARRLYERFNATLFDPLRGVYVDGEGSQHASLHANMLPVAFGLVPEKRIDSVVAFVVSKGMACSVYGSQYLLEALYAADRPEAALALMTSRAKRSWHNMLRAGSTITFEAWDDEFKPNQDWNHAWGAVPLNIIARYLVGVRPLEPGFRRALVRPMPGPLERVEATVPTIRGAIRVELQNVAGQPFACRLSIPANMTARVEVPLPDGRGGVKVDGREVTSSVQDGYAVIEEIGSGTHRVTTTRRVGTHGESRLASMHLTQE